MREIKFRGRHVGTGEWIYGNLIGNDVIVGEIVDWDDEYFCTSFWYKVDPSTVGQYTGLHDDSEDQEQLYSGDIAKVEYDGEMHLSEIKFFAGSFAFVADSLPDGFMYLNYFAEYDRDYGWVEGSEKIGNRFEHPHLLKGEEG